MNFREAQELTAAGKIPRLKGSCARCEGWGYTEAEAPMFRDGKTLQQGSGCPQCGGNGIEPSFLRCKSG